MRPLVEWSTDNGFGVVAVAVCAGVVAVAVCAVLEESGAVVEGTDGVVAVDGVHGCFAG